jgi:hypothetical protein
VCWIDLASNPNSVTTPGVGATQGGFCSILGCGGYHALNSFSFVQSSADFIGRLSIQHSNFYCGTSRSQKTVEAGSVNTIVDVDNKSFGLNFQPVYSSAGASGGRRIIDSAEEIPWTPTFANLAVVVGDGEATYTGTCTRIGRRYDWTARITTTGTCTTASTGGNTAIDKAPFPISVHSPFNVVDSTLANLGVGCAWAASNYLMTPTWAANSNDIFMSETCVI